ncbi:hypothetical protein GCM10009127_02020 [Alteraurantiacibacter aestuarii]|uniref:Exodeoxyribonuclease 7 large subunit n=1 Tax=Alteraurantiacibacter aestuarii TaxID=650004 RepID=A0A844ZLU7_9SPHN|nr:exodeoxyribonuclease VII large subunit [Alteraurantiacibacter aestuarii]MXO88544.1 exodeoxyribonuclease VII large subunit [Alteraurantiacibacter aestuarii]
MPGSNSSSDFDSASDGLVAKESAGDNSGALTITEISQALKRTVEDRFGHVKLRGELSGVKRAASGHLYCSLKDEGAVIDGVMWRGSTQRLSFVPEDGIEVIATGKLTTYPGRSKYQIVMERMEIAGEGALLALLEKTRKRLEAEGLFAPERKRQLPFIPTTIGVVTSPTGAVIRDILHRLADRFPSHVLVWPVLVQGNGAAAQISAAINGFGAMPEGVRPDLLIVARGGGSIEDLWAFNEEVVVRAIAASPIPTISAVGHETDTTLADFAADARAPTPTAAAEMAVPVRADLANTLDDLGLRQRKTALRPVTLGRERLEARAQRLPRPEQLLQLPAQKLDDLGEKLRRGLLDRAASGRERLGALRLSPAVLERNWRESKQRLDTVRLSPMLVTRPIAEKAQKLAALARLAEQLHPEKPLQRGYAMVFDAAGRPVTDKASAQVKPSLAIRFRDGDLQVVPAGRKKPAQPKAPAAEGGQPKLL